MITRRKFAGAMLGVSIAGVAVGSGGAFGKAVKAAGTRQGGSVAKADAIRQRLAQIEAESGGRLGVSIVDTTSGLHAGLRTDERFPMCSTFKLLAAGFVLTRVDHGQEDLERRIVFSESDLVPYSPATSQHTRERTGDAGMSVADLCKAAITLSDNTAANLLLASFGAPAALTAFVRSIGDGITRLDRNEPTLNEATPGDPRDTTTPNAMLGNLLELLLGERLSSSSRAQLLAWLAANQTGGERIRAKLPKDWGVGDKTGTGDHGTANDVAILWPPGRGPILVTVYLTETSGDVARCNAAIANVGALVAASV
ncbi:class A beta-lactamase [Paraburkholderia sediminicola]|uniref:class A beta-lactamase n=1 Tax=Paraburkholderia sediminicola TaxID=458836 RepID=UPI0038BC596C